MKKEFRITLRLSKELMDDLSLVSELEGETKGFIVRTVLQDYMKHYMYRNIQESNDVESEYYDHIKDTEEKRDIICTGMTEEEKKIKRDKLESDYSDYLKNYNNYWNQQGLVD